LEVGSASHAVQAARIIERFEKVCLEQKPDMVLVVGDVNSTAACTFVAAKLNIKTCHYEAGLRSGDRSMPEEINRLVTDSITDLFFTTSVDADENLLKEGVPKEKIHMVGNLMIDSLVKYLGLSENIALKFKTLDKKSIEFRKDFHKGKFGIMTFHRPSNVDDKTDLEKLVNIWCNTSEIIPLIFPIHPRTLKNIKSFGLQEKMAQHPNLFLTEPIGYLEFINLLKNATFTITDSGGIQEEATYLNMPCLTVRPNTERPVTIWEGSNKLINVDEIEDEINEILKGRGKKGSVPNYWDGNASNRIVEILSNRIM
jgi:UDP-N-acetylglucosamine 2-epimerase (non-hydrolysing)